MILSILRQDGYYYYLLLIKYVVDVDGSDAMLFFFLGSVPAYYREVYEAVHCRTDERVQVEVFQRLLQRTDLSKAVLVQVRGSHSLKEEEYCIH